MNVARMEGGLVASLFSSCAENYFYLHGILVVAAQIFNSDIGEGERRWNFQIPLMISCAVQINCGITSEFIYITFD
jgi:hypothetical protein